MRASVRAVLAGGLKPLGKTLSGIDKQPLSGQQRIETLGIEGDRQGNLRVHGGIDKAVHCYAWSHYGYWRSVLFGQALLQSPGAFGENLSMEGLDEQGVCIGDRWRIGSALLEVSQGRQPCFKLNLRFGVHDMAARVQETLKAGWYLRVIEPGVVSAGDEALLIDRPHASHSVADLLALIRDRETRADVLAPVLQLPLTSSWRKMFQQRLEKRRVESWAARLGLE